MELTATRRPIAFFAAAILALALVAAADSSSITLTSDAPALVRVSGPAIDTTVVLPFVPVTPTIDRDWSGRPWTSRATGAMAARVSGTTTTGTPAPARGRCASTAAAPLATAWGTKAWASARSPTIATNRPPGPPG